MPLNHDLNNLISPVTNRRGEKESTSFIPHLENIQVELLNAPSINDLLSYIPRWGTATWNDTPHNEYSQSEREEVLKDLFEGKILPTALETIGLVFLVSNIDKVDVTHLLRHRTMSFSAICSADRDLRNDDCLVKPSIQTSAFYERYRELVHDCKQLYSEMVDTDEISLLDARTILPASLEHHYYCRVNLKDALHFVRQRLDRQIQPESDNIVALKMWIAIVRKYPMIKGMIDLDKPDMWYVSTAPTGRSSNIYMPEKPRNDVFEHKEQWFLYKKERKDMLGGSNFTKVWSYLVGVLNGL